MIKKFTPHAIGTTVLVLLHLGIAWLATVAANAGTAIHTDVRSAFVISVASMVIVSGIGRLGMRVQAHQARKAAIAALVDDCPGCDADREALNV